MHPWHEVELDSKYPEVLPAVIEVPQASPIKYEIDKQSGLVKVDRILYSSVVYPANYGFVPKTYGEDNDPIDVLVLGQYPVVPMCIMDCRPIGVMKMIDGGEVDDKIIAVHVDDVEYKDYTDINQLHPHILKKIKQFFEDYKTLENKTVQVDAFMGPQEAKRILISAQTKYEECKTTLKGYKA